MPTGLQQSDSGHFQGNIWKLALSMKLCQKYTKLGQQLDFEQKLVVVLRLLNLLLIGLVKINFVSSTIFNVRCADCTLSKLFWCIEIWHVCYGGLSTCFCFIAMCIKEHWYLKKNLTNTGRTGSGFKQKQEGSELDYYSYSSFKSRKPSRVLN